MVSIVLFVILFQKTEQLRTKLNQLEKSIARDKITPVVKSPSIQVEKKELKTFPQPKKPLMDSTRKDAIDRTEWKRQLVVLG